MARRLSKTTSRIPPQVDSLLRSLTAKLPVILGRNLVGIYLYGSLTQKAFNPESSDVDSIVVTRRQLSDVQFRNLDSWLARVAKSNPWATRLQMSLLIKDDVLTTTPRACTYQFGVLKRSGSDGNPIIWMNVLKSGVILFGPRPESFVPPIGQQLLLEALKREVGYLREEIEKPNSEWRDVPFYRTYAVLTLCRILYSFRKGTIVSKPTAAKWAIEHDAKQWRTLVLQALESGVTKRQVPPVSDIARLIDFTDAHLHSR